MHLTSYLTKGNTAELRSLNLATYSKSPISPCGSKSIFSVPLEKMYPFWRWSGPTLHPRKVVILIVLISISDPTFISSRFLNPILLQIQSAVLFPIILTFLSIFFMVGGCGWSWKNCVSTIALTFSGVTSWHFSAISVCLMPLKKQGISSSPTVKLPVSQGSISKVVLSS